MYPGLVFLCLFIVNGAWAAKLEVSHKRMQYTLEYSEQKISLNGSGYRLNLTRTRCNHRILQQFSRQVDALIQDIPRFVDAPTPWYFAIDGKKFPNDYTSHEGMALLLLPEEVKRLKLQNKYLCL